MPPCRRVQTDLDFSRGDDGGGQQGKQAGPIRVMTPLVINHMPRMVNDFQLIGKRTRQTRDEFFPE